MCLLHLGSRIALRENVVNVIELLSFVVCHRSMSYLVIEAPCANYCYHDSQRSMMFETPSPMTNPQRLFAVLLFLIDPMNGKYSMQQKQNFSFWISEWNIKFDFKTHLSSILSSTSTAKCLSTRCLWSL